jgi:hypothetical protein
MRSNKSLLTGVGVLVWLVAGCLCAQSYEACEPAPAIKAAIDKLPSERLPSQTQWQYHEKKRTAIQALLANSNDPFVERAYVNFIARSDWNERAKVIDEYKARQAQHPDDPELAYLYGLILTGSNSPESIKLFTSALEKGPHFPWPHLGLVTIYSSPNFLDKEKAKAHVRAFLAACPTSFEGYEGLARIDDRELSAQSAAKLRAILEGRRDAEAIGAYSTLWSLEFKAHPPAEYEPLRKQAGEDLRRIRALQLEEKREWWQALEEGYKLANDQKQSDWAKDERERRFPRYWELSAREKWRKDHPYPKREDPAEPKHAYYSELLKQTAEWVKERPNTTFMWNERLDAMEHLDEVPAADLKATAEKVFQVAEDNAGPSGPDSNDYFSIAEALAKKDLEPERVVTMAKKGLEKLAMESKEPYYDLYATKDNLDDNNYYRATQRIQGLVLVTDGYLRLKQNDKVQSSLAQFDERLRELKSLASDKDWRKKDCCGRESAYWGLTARLAELQNRKLDAMAYYESSLLARFEAAEKPETGQKDEVADNAHKLWNDLGGTEEGWKTWYVRRADELAQAATLTWESANQPLPAFEIADLHGKTWTTANMKGKVTFLNFWASW